MIPVSLKMEPARSRLLIGRECFLEMRKNEIFVIEIGSPNVDFLSRKFAPFGARFPGVELESSMTILHRSVFIIPNEYCNTTGPFKENQ